MLSVVVEAIATAIATAIAGVPVLYDFTIVQLHVEQERVRFGWPLSFFKKICPKNKKKQLRVRQCVSLSSSVQSRDFQRPTF